MQYRNKVDVNPFNSLFSILMMVLVFVGLFFIAKGIFKILAFLAPFLLIGALILDYTVVVNYGKWLWRMIKTNPVVGIAGVLITIFGFPVISGFLFGKALLYRKVNKMQQTAELKKEGEFVDFEEVEEPRLKLPRQQERPQPSRNNEYENLFDED